MIIKNSIRQLLRMKGRAVLFLLLLLFASGLFSVGRGFWIINQKKTEAYESTFMTVGLVEQKAVAVEKIKDWDPEKGDYRMYPRQVYGSYHPVEVLDFEGAGYLSGPEKRVTYGAYQPDYDVYGREDQIGGGLQLGFILEVTPLEDGVMNHRKAQVNKVWKGTGVREGDIIRVCDHYNPEPGMLYADKTYVMSLYDDSGNHVEGGLEFCPIDIRSTQVGADGKVLPDEVGDDYFCEEVTEGFWESERSRRWRNWIEVYDYPNHIFPVTGTCDIQLMMPFYTGEAYLVSGREFTEEEYAQGAKVCLIPETFARKRELAVGDQVRLPLLIADHSRPAGINFSMYGGGSYVYLNAKGEPYEVFEDSPYTVIGIYSGTAVSTIDEYGMGYQEVVIPSRSVKNSDEDNIVFYSPMRGSTTSFRIENGTIEEYLSKWNRLGIDDIEITFYDKGYTELEANISNMKQISRILIAAGIIMVLLVLGYFSWIFILRQRERTAVERSLGFRKRHSFLSLFCGIFLVMLLGSAAGCTAGSCLAGRLSGSLGQTVYYDTSFGNSGRALTAAASKDAQEVVLDTPLQTAFQNVLLILAAGTGIAGAGIVLNLRQEPMKMFGSRKE